MRRLLVHVEGQTEESFVDELLAPHLYQHGYSQVSARLFGNARNRDRRGGIRGWDSAREDIARHLKEDTGCIATTMVDYYALPKSGSREWPGRAAADTLPFASKAGTVEAALLDDMATAFGAAQRLIPYVMMHEFEGLLFSDCAAFAKGIGQQHMGPPLQSIRDAFDSPEHINDSPQTAPSKRVVALIPGYSKPLHGVIASLEIGLESMRGQCEHFDDWIARLEQAGSCSA